tara:strand:- start:1329 stop:1508 length:180 start_codon:yes stop_codon:yes gene_type:complete
LKLLIGASSSKIFHLQEFAKKLNEKEIEVKVVFDADYADGFPNRKFQNGFLQIKNSKNL